MFPKEKVETVKHHKPKVKKNKSTNSDHKFVEDYNPSGTFIINERAMLDMKEKSIKMLNF